MKLGDIYKAAVEKGKSQDARGLVELQRLLDNARKAFDKLDEQEKQFFEAEKLTNPFADTRILHGDPNTEVKTILCGIDMEIGELLLADRLREKGTPIDLVLAHHPEGRGYVNLSEVMSMQADLWAHQGVAIGAADWLISPRVQEVRRGLMPANHYRAVDAARLLNLPMMCCHTVADNCVNSFLDRYLKEKAPANVGELVKVLREIPEYADSAKKGVPPTQITGSETNRVGKVFVDMTGGTSGPVDSLNKLAQAGVDTIVGMHMKEEHRKRAEELNINVVIAGHMASDTVGMNLILDEITTHGVKVICTSGMVRVDRTNSSKS